MDDARAVADAAGIERAVVIGLSEGGPLAVLFAAAFPERVRSLVLWGTFARALRGPDYEAGVDPELVEAFIAGVRDQWGTGHALEAFVTGVDDDMLLDVGVDGVVDPSGVCFGDEPDEHAPSATAPTSSAVTTPIRGIAAPPNSR